MSTLLVRSSLVGCRGRQNRPPSHTFSSLVNGTGLLGLVAGAGGIFSLTSLDLRFGATLYATSGGWGKTSSSLGSLATIDLQCLLAMEVMEGSLGSYSITKTGLDCLIFSTFCNASSLGIFLASSNASVTTPAL